MIKNLQQIKERANIADIIGERIELKKAGVNYTACCPFHEEKTPSFVVNPRKQTYFCYGCHKGGDVFDFIEQFYRYEFLEAVEFVAREVNMRVEYEAGREAAKADYKAASAAKTWWYDMMSDVSKFYYVQYWKTVIEQDKITIDGREYNAATLEAFQVSFAPQQALFNATKEGRFKLEDLLKSNLVKKSDKTDGYFDHFSNRTLFPLHDPQGRVVGFTGRKQPDANPKSPKYKNSDDSPIFNKSGYLYGLHQCGPHIMKADTAILVEGQHDLLTLYDAGILNVACTGGTALTQQHIKLLKRYAETVTICFDGDEAGIKSAARAVELIAPDMGVKVVILTHPAPDSLDEETREKIKALNLDTDSKLDPCEFVRIYGAQRFTEAIGAAQDGIIWACMKDWSADDLDKQQRCYTVAARLLSAVSETRREIYLKELVKKNRMGAVKAILAEAVSEYLASTAPARSYDATQQDTITRFGHYVKDNCYMQPINDKGGVPVSNFIVKTMVLITGNETTERYIELVNSDGYRFADRIESELFTDLGRFRAYVESKGIFVLNIKPDSWNRIREMVYRTIMRTVYPITILGLHREGFYTFKNGIYDYQQGQFIYADDNGIVTYNGDSYLITAGASFEASKADDSGDGETKSAWMTYVEPTRKMALMEWGEKLRTVYSDKAIPGMAYIITSIFRDIAYQEFSFFPHLNVFGVKGSGKNTFVESLLAIFGVPDAPSDLTNMSAKSIPRILAAVRNAIVWLDEYNPPKMDPDTPSVLRGAYGGSGRTTAEMSRDLRTRRVDPRSAVLISGEHRPTNDIALFTRCIALETHGSNFTPALQQALSELKALEGEHAFTSILHTLLTKRSIVERNFRPKVREIRTYFNQILGDTPVETRVLNNWSIICAVPELLRDSGMELPWRLDELLEYALERIKGQSVVVTEEDHLATFFRTLAFLLEDRKIEHNQDIIVQQAETIKIIGKRSSDTWKSEEYTTGKSERYLFLRLQRAHPLYLQFMKLQGGTQGLQIGTLIHYISISKWFVGKAKKKFKGETMQCLVLKLDESFPIEIALTRDIETTPFDLDPE